MKNCLMSWILKMTSVFTCAWKKDVKWITCELGQQDNAPLNKSHLCTGAEESRVSCCFEGQRVRHAVRIQQMKLTYSSMQFCLAGLRNLGVIHSVNVFVLWCQALPGCFQKCKAEWNTAQFSGNSEFSGEGCCSSMRSHRSRQKRVELTLE